MHKRKGGNENEKNTHWYHQLLFIPHKPITHLLHIEVMGIITKTCTIGAVAIYTYLKPIIHQFMTFHTKH